MDRSTNQPITIPELLVRLRLHFPQINPPCALRSLTPGPHLPLGKETDARLASSPTSPHRFTALPGNAASGAQRSAAQRSAKAWRAARAAAASPCWAGGPAGRQAGGRAGARRAGRGTRGATGPLRGRPAARALPPSTCVGGSPRSRSGPRRQVRPTYSTPADRAAGWPRHLAGRTTRRRAPPGAAPAHRVKPSGLRPGALPKSPRLRRRGSATAHHVLGPRRRRRRRRLTAALRAPGRRAGGARAQAVDRRNRRAQQPKELELEQAGLRRPSPGQRPR